MPRCFLFSFSFWLQVFLLGQVCWWQGLLLFPLDFFHSWRALGRQFFSLCTRKAGHHLMASMIPDEKSAVILTVFLVGEAPLLPRYCSASSPVMMFRTFDCVVSWCGFLRFFCTGVFPVSWVWRFRSFVKFGVFSSTNSLKFCSHFLTRLWWLRGHECGIFCYGPMGHCIFGISFPVSALFYPCGLSLSFRLQVH